MFCSCWSHAYRQRRAACRPAPFFWLEPCLAGSQGLCGSKEGPRSHAQVLISQRIACRQQCLGCAEKIWRLVCGHRCTSEITRFSRTSLQLKPCKLSESSCSASESTSSAAPVVARDGLQGLLENPVRSFNFAEQSVKTVDFLQALRQAVAATTAQP